MMINTGGDVVNDNSGPEILQRLKAFLRCRLAHLPPL